MRAKHVLPVMVILFAVAILAVPVAADHQVTFINTCNQDVYINLQGGPPGVCDGMFNGDGSQKVCSGCEQCGTSGSNPIICNTSVSTGNDTPICCPGANTDLLYCDMGQQCSPSGCCPGEYASGGQSYNCPEGGNYSPICGNTTMTKAQIDALSGYYNASQNLHRIACNGSLIAGGGFKVAASTGSQTYTFPDNWNGAFFPRTGCTFDANGYGSCNTGNCKDKLDRGLLQCGGAGSAAPASKAEINFGNNTSGDDYDMSYVNGFNIAMVFTPTQYDPTYTGTNKCTPGGCSVGLPNFYSPKVPNWDILKYTSVSNFIGIMDDCDYFNSAYNTTADSSGANDVNISLSNGYCCPVAQGYVNDSSHCGDIPAGQTCKICAGQNNNLYPFNQSGALPNSANLFFDTCPTGYAFTYNDTAALMTCRGNTSFSTNYQIAVSCPSGTLPPTTPPPSDSDTAIVSSSSGITFATAPATGAGQTVTISFNQQPTAATGVAVSSVQITTAKPTESFAVIAQPVTVSNAIAITDKPVAGYLEISAPGVPAGSINQGKITFNVHAGWLTKNNIAPENVVLMRYHDQQWSALPTTFSRASNGIPMFTATSLGFSYFAITANMPNSTAATVNTTIAATPAGAGTSTVTATTTKMVSSAMATMTTMVPAVTQATALFSSFPGGLLGIAVVIIVIIAAAAVLMYRWWIRRQNPSLFRKYD
ncbi:MAG: thaumatin family protein [Methanoregula sp.]